MKYPCDHRLSYGNCSIDQKYFCKQQDTHYVVLNTESILVGMEKGIFILIFRALFCYCSKTN